MAFTTTQKAQIDKLPKHLRREAKHRHNNLGHDAQNILKMYQEIHKKLLAKVEKRIAEAGLDQAVADDIRNKQIEAAESARELDDKIVELQNDAYKKRAREEAKHKDNGIKNESLRKKIRKQISDEDIQPKDASQYVKGVVNLERSLGSLGNSIERSQQHVDMNADYQKLMADRKKATQIKDKVKRKTELAEIDKKIVNLKETFKAKGFKIDDQFYFPDLTLPVKPQLTHDDRRDLLKEHVGKLSDADRDKMFKQARDGMLAIPANTEMLLIYQQKGYTLAPGQAKLYVPGIVDEKGQPEVIIQPKEKGWFWDREGGTRPRAAMPEMTTAKAPQLEAMLNSFENKEEASKFVNANLRFGKMSPMAALALAEHEIETGVEFNSKVMHTWGGKANISKANLTREEYSQTLNKLAEFKRKNPSAKILGHEQKDLIKAAKLNQRPTKGEKYTREQYQQLVADADALGVDLNIKPQDIEYEDLTIDFLKQQQKDGKSFDAKMLQGCKLPDDPEALIAMVSQAYPDMDREAIIAAVQKNGELTNVHLNKGVAKQYNELFGKGTINGWHISSPSSLKFWNNPEFKTHEVDDINTALQSDNLFEKSKAYGARARFGVLSAAMADDVLGEKVKEAMALRSGELANQNQDLDLAVQEITGVKAALVTKLDNVEAKMKALSDQIEDVKDKRQKLGSVKYRDNASVKAALDIIKPQLESNLKDSKLKQLKKNRDAGLKRDVVENHPALNQEKVRVQKRLGEILGQNGEAEKKREEVGSLKDRLGALDKEIESLKKAGADKTEIAQRLSEKHQAEKGLKQAKKDLDALYSEQNSLTKEQKALSNGDYRSIKDPDFKKALAEQKEAESLAKQADKFVENAKARLDIVKQAETKVNAGQTLNKWGREGRAIDRICAHQRGELKKEKNQLNTDFNKQDQVFQGYKQKIEELDKDLTRLQAEHDKTDDLVKTGGDISQADLDALKTAKADLQTTLDGIDAREEALESRGRLTEKKRLGFEKERHQEIDKFAKDIQSIYDKVDAINEQAEKNRETIKEREGFREVKAEFDTRGRKTKQPERAAGGILNRDWVAQKAEQLADGIERVVQTRQERRQSTKVEKNLDRANADLAKATAKHNVAKDRGDNIMNSKIGKSLQGTGAERLIRKVADGIAKHHYNNRVKAADAATIAQQELDRERSGRGR